ncbi:MAG: hypothetical protein FWF69_00405 [Firmicutes bacterium]|nr:hypothetical protein [Bacillota bacterium]
MEKNLRDHSDETTRGPESAEQGTQTRAMAGKALAVFLLLMLAFTWGNKMLREMTIATVSATGVQRGSLDKQYTASGSLTASLSIPILAEEPARVIEVFAKEGQTVAEGDPLFTLDYSDIVQNKKDAVQSSRDTVSGKQRSLDWSAADLPTQTLARLQDRQASLQALMNACGQAEDAYQRTVIAHGEDNAVTREAKRALDQAQYLYKTEKRRVDGDAAIRDYLNKSEELAKAQADLAKAEGEYAALLAKVREDNGKYTHTVVSPAVGYIISGSLTVGSMAPTGSASMMLSDLSAGLELRVELDEGSAGELVPGDTANVTVDGKRYDCPIVTIAGSASRQGMSELSFLLPGDAGAPGKSAEADIRKRTENYNLIIPLSALYSDSDGDFVYVVEQEESSLGSRMSVRRVDVYVLDEDSSRAALQSGLSQRDSIVTRSDRSIADGDRVRLED